MAVEDQALKTLLENFGAVHRRLDSFERRFDSIDQRFDSIDRRFDSVDGRLDGLGKRIEKVHSESVERDKRLEQRIDDVHNSVQLVAESVMQVNDKLDRFRAETAKEFDEVRAEMRAGYASLDQRIRNFEHPQ